MSDDKSPHSPIPTPRTDAAADAFLGGRCVSWVEVASKSADLIVAMRQLEREANALRTALRWYARRNHIALTERADELYDDVSGEPPNWKWQHSFDENFIGVEGYEDGGVARMALLGKELDWEGEPPEPIEGET